MIWDPASGRLARLDRVGSLIWAHLDGTSGLGELSEDLAASFGVSPETVRADVEQFVARLADLGFILEGDEPI